MSGRRTGRVVLVGAGPGAPDLVTLRGVAALRRADAVVYDALAPPELLELAPPEARLVNVGKRGHDEPTRTQDEINALLVELAREGLEVIRLKGGDPFVFGRGGEELSTCADAGIPVEVVPGICSPIGALAFAGIPVTDRRHAASFAVVTGHKDPSKPREEIRWAGLARSVDTLVVLMGMRNLEEIVQRILDAGRAPDTPAAVVMEGTTPRQRVVEAPLSELVGQVRAAGLAAPAVVVVGEAVRLRERLGWFEALPLFGRRVWVTRSPEQARGLLDALRTAGAAALPLPLIRTEALPDTAELDAALAALDRYDVLVFTSGNAVRFFADRARELGVPLAGSFEVACVGPATARAALEAGLPVHHVPQERFDAEGILEVLEQTLPRAGRRFLLPRAARARELLPEGLRAAGAEVDAVPVYATGPADFDPADLRRQLVGGEVDVLTFASPSAVHVLMDALDEPARAAARELVVAAMGPVTARALTDAGFSTPLVPERAEVEALVDVLARHFEGVAS